jgi:acid phosphatase
MRQRLMLAAAVTASALFAQPVAAGAALSPLEGLRTKIGHIIVISQENWSFDGLYGKFPKANGYGNALSFAQVDANGNPLAMLPQPLRGAAPDARFTAPLPVAPFDLAAYVPPDSPAFTGDPNHNFFFQQYQIDGGKMDRYVAIPSSSAGGLPFGYYDATNLPEGKVAQQYVLADNFHQSAFGGSFINNVWSFCACTTVWRNAPDALVEKADFPELTRLGGPERKVTKDGYAVNTLVPAAYPQISPLAFATVPALPPQSAPTIGDRLSAAGVSWAWYSGGWDAARDGHPDPTYQPHHQAPLFFENYAPGTAGAMHIRDQSAFFRDLANGRLPKVSFIKNLGANNEHPGYANVLSGEMFTVNLISQVQMSPLWKDTLIVIYYDEAGGHWDHVPPLAVDRWGPSTRVPAIVVSPWAQHGKIDHAKYEVVSILATIEKRFGLKPLGSRDAAAAPLLGGLDFNQRVPQAYARRPLGIEQAVVDRPRSRAVEAEIDE